MRRREFIAGTVATAALIFARRARAQTTARLPGMKSIAIVHVSDVGTRHAFNFTTQCEAGHISGPELSCMFSMPGRIFEVAMVALAKSISRATGVDVDVEILKTVVMFSAVGLTALLMCASYGLDLSPGFFLKQQKARRVRRALGRCKAPVSHLLQRVAAMHFPEPTYLPSKARGKREGRQWRAADQDCESRCGRC
jgi:hypothetical protein